jgi:beta-galactosidase
MTLKPMASIALCVLSCAMVFAQSAPARNMVEIDASQPIAPPETGFLHLGGRSSNGHDLEINNRYITIDGRPMLPVMGEFHFSRFPPQYWEEEILKMKAAGINIISTYIFWIHHEEIEGQFDWTGQRDLRRFVQLCARHGMYVYIRPGPWDHGEVRNGGLPDWIAKDPNIRTNDPGYLAHVARLDKEIGIQLKGLLWKDGGPVIGAQIENEYGLHGPGKGAEHILKLKELLIAAGIDVPLYSVTGWPSLDFPPHDVIPVSGGYPDGFWYASLTNLPPSMSYLFNLNRELGDMGATVPSEDPTGKVDLHHDPYFAAEEGGGMATAYHRRPVLYPDDIAALTLTGIGSGLNLYGYYMFQGGANPPGKRTTLQESSATGYPNDLPEINYDFQAPLGEYGQMRESYRKTKSLHLFLNAFGSDLAQMKAVGPKQVPKDPADTSVSRVAVRARGDSGFIFVNNYVRQLPMPQREGFQINLKLPDTQISVPAKPITVPPDSYFCWPVNLQMNGVRLEYSTAQLLTKIDTPTEAVFVFFSIPGIASEFSFAADTVESLHASGQIPLPTGSSIRLEHLSPSLDTTIEAVSKTGKHIRILLLTELQAESATVLNIDGHDHLVLSPSDIFADGGQLHVRSTDRQKLDIKIFPAMAADTPIGAEMTATKSGVWTDFRFNRPAAPISWTWKKTREAKPVGPVKMGPFYDWREGAVALVPDDSAFGNAAEWQVNLNQPMPSGVSDLFLTADYIGDIGRLYLGPTLIDDDFYNGRPWEIGLKRFLPDAAHKNFRIDILPLLPDAPIYLDARAKPSGHDQIAQLRHLTLVPEYEVLVTLRNPATPTAPR